MSNSLDLSITARTLGTFAARSASARAEMTARLDTFITTRLDGARDVLAAASPRGPEPYNDAGHVHMQDAWLVVRTGARSGLIRNATPQATFQFTGTKPHIIAARNAATLAFIGRDGTWAFPRVVHHPGTKQNQVLVNTMDTETRFIRSAFRDLGMRLAATYAHAIKDGGT